MTNALVFDMPVELGLELVPVIRPHLPDAEWEAFDDVVDEGDGIGLASRRTVSGTGITTAPVIIHCSCSISSAIWSAARFVPATSTAPTGWKGVLDPVVARYRGKVARIYFRADAGFANPDVYEYLEAEGIKYAIRLPANRVLQDRIGYLLKRPVGRPPNHVRRYYANFHYRAASWSKPRRVVAKVEWHPGELYPRVGFIVTNMARRAENVVAFYNKRGTCEQWIKEGKGAIKWTRLSCRSFAANAVRLQLHALAYNLGNFLRTLATPEPISDWSMTTLREKLIKIGAKVVGHARYVAFQMAEVAIPRNLFADILRMIAELAAATDHIDCVVHSDVACPIENDGKGASR